MDPEETVATERQRALWRIGALFLDASVEEGDERITESMQVMAETIGADSVGRWYTDLRTQQTTLQGSWVADGGLSVGFGDRVSQPEVVEQLFARDGVATLPIARLVPPDDLPDGWRDGVTLIVVVDFEGHRGSSLSLTRRTGEWDAEEILFCRGFATILRQFMARMTVERDLKARLELRDVVARSQRRMGEATDATVEAVIDEVLSELVEHLDIDTAVLFDVGDRTQLTHSAGRPLERPWHSMTTRADRRYMSRPLQLSIHALAEVAEGMLGDTARDVETDGRIAGIVPLVIGTAGQRVLGIIRDDSPWGSAAQEAVQAIARSIGETLSRVEAERWSAFRLRVQEEFAAIVAAFLRGHVDQREALVVDALGRLARSLDAPLMAIFDAGRLDRNAAGRIVTVWEEMESGLAAGGWIRHPERWVSEAIHAGETVIRTCVIDDRLIDPFNRMVTHGGHVDWTFVCIPLDGWSDEQLALALVLRGDQCHHGELMVDLLGAFGDLLAQLRVRLDREDEAAWRERTQRFVRDAAATFAEAMEHEFDEALDAVFRQATVLLDLDQVAFWWVDRHTGDATCRSALSVEPRPTRSPEQEPGAIRRAAHLDAAVVEGGRAVVPAAGTDRSTVLVAERDARSFDDREVQVLAELVELLHQTQERVSAERYSQTAFGEAPIGIILCDSDFSIITCNPAFVAFVGYESVASLVAATPDDLLDTIDRDPTQGVHELPFKRADGNRVWGLTRSTPIESATTGEQMWLVHVEDVTERRRADQLLRYQASHDELTGLSNRRVLTEAIERALGKGETPAVLLLDLDRFKNINDSLGHDRGDELLVTVADRLRLAVRPGDLVTRLGGDEFAVLLRGSADEVDARLVADRLLSVLGEPMRVGGQLVFSSASIGIAVADPSTTVADLLRCADIAMYRAKDLGRSCHAVFDEVMRDEINERLELEAGLRRALDAGELLVHYQPEVSLRNGRILGAEALVRWEHPERGLLPAGVFIPVAEETGLVEDIGALVLRDACDQAASWPDLASTVRVNVAAAQLQHFEIVALVGQALDESGLEPDRLCIEITESAMMDDVRKAEEVLRRLKALGVRVAVDDFGTGFSSLAYLKRFPVDALKIDRAFVDGLEGTEHDDTLVRSIISLAKELRLDVVAEGVESQSQADTLIRLGCHRAQGYFFGRPMPAAELMSRFAAAT